MKQKSTVFTEQPTKEIKPYFLKQDPAQDLTNTEAPGGCRLQGYGQREAVWRCGLSRQQTDLCRCEQLLGCSSAVSENWVQFLSRQRLSLPPCSKHSAPPRLGFGFSARDTSLTSCYDPGATTTESRIFALTSVLLCVQP